MKIGNKKVLKRVLEVSLLTGFVLTTFTGSTDHVEKPIIIEIEDNEEKDYFCTYEEIKDYKYYLICTDDSNYEENVYLTKIPSYSVLERLENNRIRYYYNEVFTNKLMGSVVYDKITNEIKPIQGPRINYVISLSDYIEYYNIQREGYTKEQLKVIYDYAKEEFKETNFKSVEKEKILIRDNYQ